MIKFKTVIFFSFVSLIQLAAQSHKVPLTTKMGAHPIIMRLVVCDNRASEKRPVCVPEIFTDYKTFEILFMPDYETDQREKNLRSVSGFYMGEKFVMIDTNFDGNFSDEQVIYLDYDAEKYLDYAQRAFTPPSYAIDETTRMDNYDQNELIIRKRILVGDKYITLNQEVEITPNFSIFPNPDKRFTNPKVVAYFPYTFTILNIVSKQASFEYNNNLYNISIQKDDVNESFAEGYIKYQVSNLNDTLQNNTKVILNNYPDRLVVIGNEYFEPQIDEEGTELILTPIDRKEVKLEPKDYSKISKIEGTTIAHQRLQSFNISSGKVLVHFWGSWCGACKHDYYRLVEIKDRKYENLKILGVAANM